MKYYEHHLQTLIWKKFSDCFFSWICPFGGSIQREALQKSYLCIWCMIFWWIEHHYSKVRHPHTHLYTIEFGVEEHKGYGLGIWIKIPVILNRNKKATPWFQIWSTRWQERQQPSAMPELRKKHHMLVCLWLKEKHKARNALFRKESSPLHRLNDLQIYLHFTNSREARVFLQEHPTHKDGFWRPYVRPTLALNT